MAGPILYLFVGYPGSGKTTIAKLIEAESGAVHIWSDNERHKMFAEPNHSQAESNQLYKELNQRTAKLLHEGHNVIFDTNFNHLTDRDHLRQIAGQSGAETIVVWVNTPLEVAKQRAVHSDVVRNNYAYVMSQEQFNDIAAKLEPPTDNENVIKIDGTNIDRNQVIKLLSL